MKERGLVYDRGKLPKYCERLMATGRGWAGLFLNSSVAILTSGRNEGRLDGRLVDRLFCCKAVG